MPPPLILCIDNRPELLQIRKATLERLGASVVTATTSIAALGAVEPMPIAAVLLEYSSEGMDVEALVLHIKQRFPSKPVILLSAHSDLPERVLWLVDEYVMRSDPPERVLQLVKQMTRGTGAARAAAG